MMNRKVYTVVTALVLVFVLTACSSSNNNGSELDNNMPTDQTLDNQPSTNQPSDNQTSDITYLFTANEGGSINKINVVTNEVTDTVEVDGSVHNVQLSPDGTILAVTVVPVMANEGAEADHDENAEDEHGHDGVVMNGFVQFYEAANVKLVTTVEVGNHPAHVVYTSDGKNVLVTNNEGNNLMVINTSDYRVVQTIDTGKGPHGFRISADDKYAYIANMGEDTISVIDLVSMKESKRIRVGAAPVTTGVTKDGKTLAVTLNAENAMAIVDLSTDKVEKIDVGIGPAQVYVQADGQYAYVANQGTKENPSRTVTKIDLIDKKAVATIETGDGAHGLITSPDSKLLYVTNMFEDSLSVIDNEKNQVINTISTGVQPNGITITP